VLEAINLDCVHDERRLFERLDFQIKAMKCLFFHGESGSDKTNLFRMLIARGFIGRRLGLLLHRMRSLVPERATRWRGSSRAIFISRTNVAR